MTSTSPADKPARPSVLTRYRAFRDGNGAEETGALMAVFTLTRITTGVARKFRQDRCFTHAASLAYATLVALAPMTVLGFTFFSAFDRYDALRSKAEDAIFSYFMPSVGEQVVTLLDQVTANLQRLSLPGLLLFLFAATLLLNSLEGSFNVIWSIRRNRSYVSKLVISWSLLTLVPAMLAGGYVLADRLNVYNTLSGSVRFAITCLCTWIAFFFVLYVLPHTRTRVIPSLAGGFLGALVWIVSRGLFVYYVANVSPVQAVLGGGLATVALFLIWVYFSWVVLLFSAETAYVIQYPRTRGEERQAKTIARSYRTFYLVLMLVEICRRYRDGESGEAFPGDLAVAVGIPPALGPTLCEELLRSKLVYRTDGGALVPSRPPAELDLADVAARSERHALAAPDKTDSALSGRVAELFRGAASDALSRLDGHTIGDLLDHHDSLDTPVKAISHS